MYDIKQFRPSLYLVILAGITGFCMAAESPGLWVISATLVLVNAWLIHRGQFKPIRRSLAAAVSLIAFIYALFVFRDRPNSSILTVGQFLVFLHLVKIWEQRANRDYAQLLVLSLLLMVSAAISTASLLFGLLFIGYLFLSLYCCLLFHLKVETDEAKAALGSALAQLGEGPLRQDQAHLARSMRRLTGLVAVYAGVSAVLVFLLFPRNTGAGLFGQLQSRSKSAMTGFSEEVSFQTVARISQNDEVLGTVKIWQDDKILPSREPLLLRGLTHDYYNGNDKSDHAAYQWSHARPIGMDPRRTQWEDMAPDVNGVGTWTPREYAINPHNLRDPDPKPHFRQEIDLNPTGTQVLFSMAGITSMKLEDAGNLRRPIMQYSASDQTMKVNDVLNQPIRYQVEATGDLGNQSSGNHRKSNIDPQISRFARIAEVTNGLAQQRDAEVAARPDRGLFYTSPLDAQIARNIETYLRRNYKYTLDLTDTQQIEGRDPMVAFLYDFKKGHCEYFAGAMTLLCQSLGMDARLVIGFKCDDYNEYGHFYTIRQSHAHAWVEVRTTNGWMIFDPTSGNVADAKTASMWAGAKRIFDFLEYTWQNSVISYNSENRDSLVQTAENKLTQTANHSTQSYNSFKDWVDSVGNSLATHVIGPLIILLATAIFGAIGWYIYERWKLRRRARRIGIVDLPPSAQAKLIRQLGFYDDLLQLLERHRIYRPAHLTPLEFCDSLSFLPSKVYDTIHRITQLSYRIRYGQSELDAGQLRRLDTVIERLSHEMPVVNAE